MRTSLAKELSAASLVRTSSQRLASYSFSTGPDDTALQRPVARANVVARCSVNSLSAELDKMITSHLSFATSSLSASVVNGFEMSPRRTFGLATHRRLLRHVRSASVARDDGHDTPTVARQLALKRPLLVDDTRSSGRTPQAKRSVQVVPGKRLPQYLEKAKRARDTQPTKSGLYMKSSL